MSSVTAALEIPGRARHEARGDLAHAIAVARHEGPVADEIDHAGNALAELVDLREGAAGERQGAGQAGHAHAVLDVAIGLLARQRLEIASDVYLLIVLAQPGATHFPFATLLPLEHEAGRRP